ncbi:MAG: PD40 domain-containing protein [Chloroflexota bacterium]|nr:PD40 domain-containing protein [Chloroflexota bacterium]
MVTGTWQTLAANASAWYYFDYTADKSRAEVDLDTYGVSNITFAIYTPAQANAWQQDPTTAPVAFGTPPGSSSASAIHDLIWLGAFNTGGRYFAVVSNNNSTPVPYRLLVSGSSVMLAPTPTPTPIPTPLFATPIPTGTIQGKLIFQNASGGDIYTVNGDGSNLTRVESGLDPSWSPDGKWIAFSRWSAPAGLYIANADGSNEQAIFDAQQLLSPQWSPDGTRIIFTQQKGGSTGGAPVCFRGFCFPSQPDPHWKLGVIDLSSGALSEPPCSLHCFSPTWSSDNHTAAYADAGFGVLTTDTNPNSGPPTTIYSQVPAVQSAMWSPDGSRIVFQVRQHDHWEISVMNTDGGNPLELTHPNPLSFAVVNNVAPTWSPDGSQVLFLSDRGGKWEFFIIDVDGTGLRQVLKNVSDSIPIHYNFSNERVIDWSK